MMYTPFNVLASPGSIFDTASWLTGIILGLLIVGFVVLVLVHIVSNGRSKRQIAKYVAEGKMTAEDAEKLLASNESTSEFIKKFFR